MNRSYENETDSFNVTSACALFDFTIYTVVVGSLCLLGLAGNIVSFTVLFQDSNKSATALLLRAMAVADSLVLITAVPLYSLSAIYPYAKVFESYYILHMGILAYLWPLYLIPYTGTILLTVLVSLNRYIAVCKPFKSVNFCSTTAAKKQILYIALFSIAYNIPRFFEYEKVTTCVGVNKTTAGFQLSAFGDNRYYRIIYANVLYFVVMHGGPLLSLAFLNVKLIRALKRRQKKRAQMGKGDYQQDVTLVLVVVIFVFMSCQTPTFIDHILWTAVDESARNCGHWHYYYTAIGDMLAITNSSVNFIIYISTNRKFRQMLVATCASSSDFHTIHIKHDRMEMTVATKHNNNGVNQL